MARIHHNLERYPSPNRSRSNRSRGPRNTSPTRRERRERVEKFGNFRELVMCVEGCGVACVSILCAPHDVRHVSLVAVSDLGEMVSDESVDEAGNQRSRTVHPLVHTRYRDKHPTPEKRET